MHRRGAEGAKKNFFNLKIIKLCVLCVSAVKKGKIMNGNMLIKNAAELVTCSGFRAKKGKEMADLHII